MKSVDYTELESVVIEYDEFGDELTDEYYEGVLFTGIAIDVENGYRSEYHYLNGRREGKSVGYYPNGNKCFESFYSKGKAISVSREWYETGQLKMLEDFSPQNRIVDEYFENGNLFRQYDHNKKERRRYYQSGILKTLTHFDPSNFREEAFSPSSELAYVEYDDVDGGRKYTFNTGVLKNHFMEMADEVDLRSGITYWFWELERSNFNDAMEVLNRLIGHKNQFVQMAFIGIASAHAFKETLTSLMAETNNPTIPYFETNCYTHGGMGYGNEKTVGDHAKDAIASIKIRHNIG